MKKFLALILSVAMIFALVACGSKEGDTPNTDGDTQQTDTPAAPVDIVIATGGTTGTYYAVGNALVTTIGDKLSLSKLTAVDSGASKANVQLVTANQAQMSILQSDVLNYAHNGSGGETMFDGAADKNSLWVAGVYNETVQLVTAPSITSIEDLKGKTVSIGAKGSGVYFNALDLLGAYGLTENDIKPEYLNFGDSTDSLKDGKIDAAFVVAGAPTPAVQDLSTGKQVYLVSLDKEHVDSLIASSPYYKEYTISKEVYNTPEDVTTVAVAAVVIARNDVSEAAIYNFVSAIFNNINDIGHAKKAELSLDFASSITNVPYHPGAAKYFAEKDITVNTAA